MMEPEIGLITSPSKFLKFVGPFNQKSTAQMVTTNKSKKNRFSFKIKSNAQKNRLSVTPSTGIVEPGQAIVHKVVLAPAGPITASGAGSSQVFLKDTTPLSYTILIQSLSVGPEVANVGDIWREEESSGNLSRIEKIRLECVYETGGHRLVRQPILKFSGGRRQTMHGTGRLAFGAKPQAPPSAAAGDGGGGLVFSEVNRLNNAFVETPVPRPQLTYVTGNELAAQNKDQQPTTKRKPSPLKMIKFQPVIQAPQTATVVFPPMGTNDLGELEFVNDVTTQLPAAVLVNSNDTNNNKKDDATGKGQPANGWTASGDKKDNNAAWGDANNVVMGGHGDNAISPNAGGGGQQGWDNAAPAANSSGWDNAAPAANSGWDNATSGNIGWDNANSGWDNNKADWGNNNDQAVTSSTGGGSGNDVINAGGNNVMSTNDAAQDGWGNQATNDWGQQVNEVAATTAPVQQQQQGWDTATAQPQQQGWDTATSQQQQQDWDTATTQQQQQGWDTATAQPLQQGWDTAAAPAADAAPPFGLKPVEPSSNDEQIKMLLTIIISAIAVFLFGMLLGKAGL